MKHERQITPNSLDPQKKTNDYYSFYVLFGGIEHCNERKKKALVETRRQRIDLMLFSCELSDLSAV